MVSASPRSLAPLLFPILLFTNSVNTIFLSLSVQGSIAPFCTLNTCVHSLINHSFLEYWGARHASQFRPASLATSNLTANLPEIHSRSLHSDPRSQAAAFAGSGIPSVPGGSQRSLYPRCNNITALREELQAINTGIARALCSLQDLGSQLSSYRSLQSVQGIMPSANMETVQPAGLNNTDPQISTEQNAYNTEMWNQAHNTAHRTSISTAPSETPNNAEGPVSSSSA